MWSTYHSYKRFFTHILVSPNNLPHTLYCWKCLTPLMWALLHGAYPAVEEHVDPVVAAHCIVAVMPFPVLSCFLSLGCPLLVAAFEGQSFHQKSQGQTDRTRREMWISVGDPCSSGKDRRNVKLVQAAKCVPGPADLTSHTDLKGWAVLITGGGRGCGPILSTARIQQQRRWKAKTQICLNITFIQSMRHTIILHTSFPQAVPQWSQIHIVDRCSPTVKI